MNEKVIRFKAIDLAADARNEYPVPAFTQIPKWYKDAPAPNIDASPGMNLKACAPFLDALTTGYLYLLPNDLRIRHDGNRVTYDWSGDQVLIDTRSESALPVMPGFLPVEFTWMSYIETQTPPGYSMFLTHPLNRYDLPFVTLSGVVDTDFHTDRIVPANLPFLLRSDFEGIIPAGTPIAQIIPLRRDPWTHTNEVADTKAGMRSRALLKRHFMGNYRRLFWQRKSYK